MIIRPLFRFACKIKGDKIGTGEGLEHRGCVTIARPRLEILWESKFYVLECGNILIRVI